jgi:hypothetical protein
MGNGMTIRWLLGLALVWATVMASGFFVSAARADEAAMPGIRVEDESTKCTAGFAAQGADGSYYLMISGHCDRHDGSPWTYGDNVPLGKIAASELEGEKRDAAIILLDPSVGAPLGHVGGQYSIRDVLSLSQVEVGMPFCKIGAVTGETCGEVESTVGGVVKTSVFSLTGDSGSPGFVKNPDGTVSAVGLLTSSPDGDDNTTYFVAVDPLLGKWGLRILE